MSLNYKYGIQFMHPNAINSLQKCGIFPDKFKDIEETSGYVIANHPYNYINNYYPLSSSSYILTNNQRIVSFEGEWLRGDIYKAPTIKHRSFYLHPPINFEYIKARQFIETAGYPHYPNGGLHSGIDLAPRINKYIYDIPVYAVEDGLVTYSLSFCNCYIDSNGREHKGTNCSTFHAHGNMITLLHNDGLKTKYMHLKTWSVKLKKNHKVLSGDYLGMLASTGNSTGPHLHFSRVRGTTAINPYPYMLFFYDINSVISNYWALANQNGSSLTISNLKNDNLFL